MNDLAPVASFAVGYAWQWTRAPKRIPNWAGYLVFCLVATIAWYWMNLDAQSMITSDWRQATASIVNFALAARGSASTLSDIKLAPATNSIGRETS